MKTFVVAMCLAGAVGSAHAAEYLGLDLGVATKEKIAQQLKASSSPFEAFPAPTGSGESKGDAKHSLFNFGCSYDQSPMH